VRLQEPAAGFRPRGLTQRWSLAPPRREIGQAGHFPFEPVRPGSLQPARPDSSQPVRPDLSPRLAHREPPLLERLHPEMFAAQRELAQAK
jgi:hypothetical protein